MSELFLEGRTALVCGSTSGLGEAAARGLAAAGARVAVTGRREEKARRIAAELNGAVALACDLTAPDGASSLAAETKNLLGEIDILVLSGPGPSPSSAAAMDDTEMDAALFSLFHAQRALVNAFLPGMRSRGWGRIIGIGSSGVEAPIAGLATSNAARWAFAAYAKTLAGEVAADGVTVNLVLPGRIATDRVATLDSARAERSGISVEEVARRSTAAIPIGRYGRPEEFAAPIVFLASPAASYITGTALRCDGGMIPVL